MSNFPEVCKRVFLSTWAEDLANQNAFDSSRRQLMKPDRLGGCSDHGWSTYPPHLNKGITVVLLKNPRRSGIRPSQV